MTAAPALELAGIRLRRGTTTILDGLDLAVAERELVVLTGPSGSGKTSALRVALGLSTPDEGIVRIGGRVAGEGRRSAIGPEARQIGAVFQDLALWPHLTVHGNLAFGLADLARGERDARIHEMLGRVGLGDKARRYPGELSGGEGQRVAIARALVLRPRIVALDEPLSNIDVALAHELRELFRELLRERGIATIYVTHDPRDAERLADRIAILEAGRSSRPARLPSSAPGPRRGS
jgi:iron(III) transport system ATP-binding protein